MKQKFACCLLALLCSACSILSFAQDETDTSFITRMNHVFALLEKDRVPTGLLLDYAMEFANLESYAGTLTDSNKVNAGLLYDIYSTLFMSAIHSNAGGFYSPGYVDSAWQSLREPGLIILSGLYYNYSRFRDDAISGNLLTLSGEQYVYTSLKNTAYSMRKEKADKAPSLIVSFFESYNKERELSITVQGR